MAKRFTESEKWKDDWFLSLSNNNKVVWQYLLDNCTTGGIIKLSMQHLNFCCKTKLTIENIFEIYRGRVFNMGSYAFIPKFVTFQYPAGLNSDKPAIVGVRKELNRYGLLNNDNTILANDKLMIANDYLIIKDKDKDKDIVKDMDTDKDKDGELVKIDFKKIPPTLEIVKQQIKERKLNVDAERFMAHYESNGWKVGKAGNKMKDWNATLTTWNSNNYNNGTFKTKPINDIQNTSPGRVL